jgi:GTP-binding protein
VPGESAERLAVTAAIRTIERSHVTVVLFDALDGIAEQDAKILGLALERGRAIVIGLNKWDTVRDEDLDDRKHRVQRTSDLLSFAQFAQRVKLSALTGVGVDRLLDQVDSAFAQFCKRIPTSKVNRLFEDIIDHHPPSLHKGKVVKLYYATQASTRPPTFVVQTNHPDAIHFSYKRYIQNRLRKSFDFKGTPVRVFFRGRKKRRK